MELLLGKVDPIEIQIESEELGKSDKNNFYHTHDGILYFTPIYEDAERYATPTQREKDKGLLGIIHTRTLTKGSEKCVNIAETHGGACAMWQDQLIDLCNKGVRYVFSNDKHRQDIFDISQFADFVEKRDTCIIEVMDHFNLRLPKETESLTEYIEDIKNPRITLKDFDNGPNKEKI